MNSSKTVLNRLFKIIVNFVFLISFSLSLLIIIETALKTVDISIKVIAFFVVTFAFIAFLIPKNPFVKKLKEKPRLYKASIVIAVIIAIYAPVMGIMYMAYPGDYIETKTGFENSEFLKNKKALVIAPHQDDEVNIAANMMEELLANGSDVFVIYATNGDYYDLADVRQKEAIESMERIGVPKENLIFLGYGDMSQDRHLYNAAPDEIVTSQNGHSKTYSGTYLPDFATQFRGKPNDYTRQNALNDLKDAISLVHPDIIICSDYDKHPDHKATSLFFEEAMGQLLAENDNWKPIVLKSLSYYTRWNANADFYNIPLKQTEKPNAPNYPLGTPSYRWEERIRIPMAKQFLTFKALDNEFREIYDCYKSQYPISKLLKSINSDEIYFLRNTDSLLYGEELVASSGNAKVLNDFKLFDTTNVNKHIFDGGCWIPTDDEKTVVCNFSEPVTINSVTLWDNPSPDDNVVEAQLVLSDGSVIDISNLDFLGAKTEIRFDTRENIVWAKLILTKTQGKAGITELELVKKNEAKTQFIKIVDEEDNFIYNAPVVVGENKKLSLYSYGELNENEFFRVEITQLDGDYSEIIESVDPDNISLIIPQKGDYKVRITSNDNAKLFDECILTTHKNCLTDIVINGFERACVSIYSQFACYYSELKYDIFK